VVSVEKPKPPRLSPEERAKHLALQRRIVATAAFMQDHVRNSFTQTNKAAFIRAFVDEQRIQRYPAPDEELRDENVANSYGKMPLPEWFTVQIGRVLERNAVRADLSPRNVANQLLMSHDEELGRDLGEVPVAKVDPSRILGHVEWLKLGLSPQVTASIARRLYFGMLNQAMCPKGDIRETDFCPDCGRTFSVGDRCACPE